MHEDNDVLGIFSPEEYTHTPPGKGAFQLVGFIAAVFGLCGVVRLLYPDKPSVKRAYPGGLFEELGGRGALHVEYTLVDTMDVQLIKRRHAVLRKDRKLQRNYEEPLGHYSCMHQTNKFRCNAILITRLTRL